MVIFYIILAAVVTAAAVVLVKLKSLHVTVFAVAALLALLAPLPVYSIATAVAKNDQQTFHEYWNGYETNAYTHVQECVRDGQCQNTYQCDPYTVWETETYVNSEGDLKTRTVQKTKYHSCPYSDEETSFYVDSTLKTFTIASNLMTGGQFRSGAGIPGGQVTEAPAEWTAAKARLDAGTPGGVTMVSDYKNYILGSERSLFKRYSDQIDELTADGLLPAPTSGVTGSYNAQKVHFVGDLDDISRQDLVKDMQNLNGAVGTELRGDLHMVFVDTQAVSISAEDYSNALLAYWQSKDAHGRDTIAKNAIIVVVGVEAYQTPEVTTEVSPSDSAVVAPEIVIADGTPVASWVKAFTGMPVGNESLMTQFSSELKGEVIGDDFLGSPTYDVSAGTVKHTDGLVESILWGVNKFERVSMDATEEDDNGSGFAYLADEWKPDTGTMVVVYIISSILFLAVMAGGFFMSGSFKANGTKDFIPYLFTKH